MTGMTYSRLGLGLLLLAICSLFLVAQQRGGRLVMDAIEIAACVLAIAATYAAHQTCRRDFDGRLHRFSRRHNGRLAR